jgi:phage baseplate assembly protein W
MAVIDLNNLIRPKQTYNPNTQLSNVVTDKSFTYSDLHLDLVTAQNIGDGLNPVDSNDILIDLDLNAIKNSLRNIFTTKKGQKILNPEFGSALEQYLFTPITETNARVIGNEILNSISNYEPRVKIMQVEVVPRKDENLYKISIYYQLLELNKQNVINMIAELGGQVSF